MINSPLEPHLQGSHHFGQWWSSFQLTYPNDEKKSKREVCHCFFSCLMWCTNVILIYTGIHVQFMHFITFKIYKNLWQLQFTVLNLTRLHTPLLYTIQCNVVILFLHFTIHWPFACLYLLIYLCLCLFIYLFMMCQQSNLNSVLVYLRVPYKVQLCVHIFE